MSITWYNAALILRFQPLHTHFASFFFNDSHETVRNSIDRTGKNYKIITLEGRNQEKEKNTTTHFASLCTCYRTK